MISIYVLPTVEGLPPRALLMDGEGSDEEIDAVKGLMAMWSRDLGCWVANGSPLTPELSEAITDHARSLGVAW